MYSSISAAHSFAQRPACTHMEPPTYAAASYCPTSSPPRYAVRCSALTELLRTLPFRSLNRNKIGGVGAAALCEGLKVNTSVQTLT